MSGTTIPRRPFCAPRRGPSTARPSRAACALPATARPPRRTVRTVRTPVARCAASTPSVMGRSNEAACLGSSAGARLITTRSCGRWKPELTIARSTRCVLSLTAASGNPTRMVLGIAACETSTSTSTGTASMPSSENVCSLANMVLTSRWPAFSLSVARALCRLLPPPCKPLPAARSARVTYVCHRQTRCVALLAGKQCCRSERPSAVQDRLVRCGLPS